MVLGVCSASKAAVYRNWKELELQLADAASESKETVKYLTTLEGSLECLYTRELRAMSCCAACRAEESIP